MSDPIADMLPTIKYYADDDGKPTDIIVSEEPDYELAKQIRQQIGRELLISTIALRFGYQKDSDFVFRSDVNDMIREVCQLEEDNEKR